MEAKPTDTFFDPVVFEVDASFPIDTLSPPVVFASKLKGPIAILFVAVVLAFKAFKPTATLLSPDVSAANTPTPTPVFPVAESKVPVLSLSTNKLFVKFDQPSLVVMPSLPPLF